MNPFKNFVFFYILFTLTNLQAAITGLTATNTDVDVTFRFKNNVTSDFHQIFIDTKSEKRGYSMNGINAHYLIENGNLLAYTGAGKNWSFVKIGTASFSSKLKIFTFKISRSQIGETNLCLESSSIFARVSGKNGSVVTQTPVLAHTFTKSATCTLTEVPKRNPLLQPFSSKSIWNMPIGSAAIYVPANLSPNPGQNKWAKIPGVDQERIFLTPTAPLTDIYYSSVGWKGGDRCDPTSSLILASVPMPTNYLVPNSNRNESTTFLMPDKRSLIAVQPLARCLPGGPGTSLVSFKSEDIYGEGISGAHGGSGLSSIGGSLRLGELRPGMQGPKHALKVNVYAAEALYRCTSKADCFRWPATTGDSYAVGSYGSINDNKNIAMKMGALLAIPATTIISNIGLETAPALQLAWTLQNYGAYVVDDTATPGFDINAEVGPAGSKLVEFQNDWGFSMEAKVVENTPWMRDLQRLMKALHVINNNGPSSVGGGGIPRQPLLPEISPN